MDLHAFRNRLKSLYNIDRPQLPELEIGAWGQFQDNPVSFFIRANDTHADAIWREVERRQKPGPADAVPELLAAAQRALDVFNDLHHEGRADGSVPVALRAAIAKAEARR